MKFDRSSLLRAALRTLAITAAPAALQAQDIISINFGANEENNNGIGNINNGSALTAGAVPVAGTYWNNALNATQAVPQALISDSGAASGASVTWSSANTWRSGSTGATATSLNGNLTKGYLDDGGSGAIVNVSNVPYLAYDVYVIRGSDQGGGTENANANYRPVSINGINYQGNQPLNTVSTSTIVGGAQTTGFNWTNDDVLLDGRNFHYAPGQAGLSLTVRGNTGAGRGPIAGLQIVNSYAGTLRYWDIDGSTAGSGGTTPSGTWDNATANWNDAAGTGAGITWTGVDEAAVFSAGNDATGAYTVTVSGSQTTDAVLLENGNLTLSGGAVNLVNAGIVRSFTPGGTLTIDSDITSAGNVTFEGAGSITLNGTASHTGATNVSSSFSLGATGVIDSTASFNIGNAVTAFVDGSITSAGPINLSNANILGSGTIVAGGDVNMNNVGTTNNLTLAGAGSLTATTGSLFLNRGAISLSGDAAVSVRDLYNRTGGIIATVDINDSASLDVAGFMVLGDNTGAAATITQTGGSVTNTGTTNNPAGNSMSNRWGHWGGGANVIYNLSGGSLNLTGAPLYLSWDSPVTLNVSGTGVANLRGIDMGYGNREQVSTINLNAGGTLNIGPAGILSSGTANKIINLNGGTLGATSSWATTAPMNVLASSVVDSSGGDIQLGGVLSGTGDLTIQGGGNVGLGGINTLTGAVTVASGNALFGGDTTATVTVNSGAGFGAGTTSTPGSGFAADVVAENGSVSNFRVSDTASDFVDLLDLNVVGTHTVTLTPAGLIPANTTFTVIDYATLSGAGFGGIEVASSTPRMTVALEPDNGTSIDVTVLSFDALVWQGTDGGNPNLWDLGTTQNWLTTDTAVGTAFLQNDIILFDDTAATGDITLSGALEPASTTFDNNSVSYVLSGDGIAGPGGLVKNGPGTLELRNANAYAGATFVNEGTLIVGDGTSGSLPAGGTVTVDGELQINPADGGTYSNPTTFIGAVNVTGTGDMTFVPPITNASTGPLAFNRDGTVLCTASNQTGGTVTVNAGTVIYDGNQTPNRLPNNKLVTVNNATLQIQGVNALPNHANSCDVTLNASSLKVFTGASPLTNEETNSHLHLRDITLDGGSVNLEYSGSGGAYNTESIQLNGSIIVTGSTPSSINSGAGTDATNSGLALQGIRTFDVADVTASPSTDLVVSAELENSDSNDGALTKTGLGTLRFFGDFAHTYTGNTTVDAGTLIADGSITGPLVVNAAGTISPGNGVGDFTTGPATLAGTYACGIDGPASDTLVVNGDLILTGATLNVSELGSGATQAVYVIATYTGFRTDAFTVSPPLPAGYSVNYNDALKQVELVTGGDSYASWESTNGIPGAGPEVDSDNDRIDNGIEFVIGGDPSGPGSDSSALLPTTTVDATYLNFTFRRTDESAPYNPFVEYGSTLQGWTQAQAGVDGVIVNETNDIEPGVDSVEVKIPRALADAPGTEFFARLRVDIPTL